MKTVDIIIIAIIAIFGFIGYKKGLIKSLIGIFSFVLATIFATSLLPIVSKYFMTTKLFTAFSEFLTKIFPASAIKTTSVSDNGNIFSNDFLGNFLDNIASIGGKVLIKSFVDGVAILIVNVFCFILLFICAKFLLKIIASIIDKIFSLPFLNLINNGFGFVLGGFKGFVFIYFAIALIIIFTIKTPSNPAFAFINETIFKKYLIDENIILNLFIK